jgi:lysophospholipase L1-like esterase
VAKTNQKSADKDDPPHSNPAYLVSLGDSVAAGDGLPVTGPGSLATVCAQSNEAYASLVAQARHLTLKQFACSGATVAHGVLGSQAAGGQQVPPQLTAATPYIQDSDVLITIGANDVKWASTVYACATSDCGTAGQLSAFEQNLSRLNTNLTTLAQDLHNLHPRKVVFNTYYPLLNSTDTCLASRGITADKISWVNARESDLNTAITKIAEKYKYQSVAVNFSGHLLCDSDPWIQSLNDPAPLHPTAAGQAGIATQDERTL